MDFTRQPIIETVITAKEGCKLVVRSSKGAGQEEYFVDAVEVVSFGSSFFFRSQEKPKSFLVPASDYEILEVREARMVLKNVGFDRTIKIGGGKESQPKAVKEPEKLPPPVEEEEELSAAPTARSSERKRDRRRSFRRRRRGDEGAEGETIAEGQIPFQPPVEKPIELPEPKRRGKAQSADNLTLQTAVIKSLLPPPPNLISDTIEKYKDNKLFEGVFIARGEEKRSREESRISEKAAEDDLNISEVDEIAEACIHDEVSYGEETFKDKMHLEEYAPPSRHEADFCEREDEGSCSCADETIVIMEESLQEEGSPMLKEPLEEEQTSSEEESNLRSTN